MEQNSNATLLIWINQAPGIPLTRFKEFAVRVLSDPSEEVKWLNLDRSSSSDNDDSTPATEFSNVQSHIATKNSNADEIYNLGLNPINISLGGTIKHENFNKPIQNDLISEWAGSDTGHIWP